MKTTTPSSKPKRAENRSADDAAAERPGADDAAPAEYGGPRGKEPTRYGDWERNGRCIDF